MPHSAAALAANGGWRPGRALGRHEEVAMHQPPIPHVARTDPEIAGLIEDEARREFEKIRLIP